MSGASIHLTPGTEFAGYWIEGIAGRGGMGVVYRATHVALQRTVALKLITPELAADQSFRLRFQREWRLAASIDHPNVVRVENAGEHEGTLYVAMPFIEGQDLKTLIAQRGRLSPEEAANIIGQVAAGLDAAHAAGLVHRDVKPANILIRGGHAYLTDFGLAKSTSTVGGDITSTGHWVGTPDFVAPEQIEGVSLDARTDVYALGCVLFMALTGRPPFDKEGDAAKLWGHMHGDVPSVGGASPGLVQHLDAVIARALEKDPAKRYPSAGDLARALSAVVHGNSPTHAERSVATGDAAPTAADFGRGGALPVPSAPPPTLPPQQPAWQQQAATGWPEPQPPPRQAAQSAWQQPQQPQQPPTQHQQQPAWQQPAPQQQQPAWQQQQQPAWQASGPGGPGDTGGGSSKKRWPLVAAGVAVLAAVAVGVLLLTSKEDPEPKIRAQIQAWADANTPEENCAPFSDSYIKALYDDRDECEKESGEVEPVDIRVDSVEADGDKATAEGVYTNTKDPVKFEMEKSGDEWLMANIIDTEADVRLVAGNWASAEGADTCDFYTEELLERQYGDLDGCRKESKDLKATEIKIDELSVNGESATVNGTIEGDQTNLTLVGTEPERSTPGDLAWLIDKVDFPDDTDADSTGGGAVDSDAVAAELEEAIERGGEHQIDVSCPSDLESASGTKFTCDVTGSLSGSVRTTQTDDAGQEFKYKGTDLDGDDGSIVSVSGNITLG